MDSQREVLTAEPTYKALLDYFNTNGKKLNMSEMFKSDPDRFSKFSQILNTADGDLLVDYSKNIVNDEVMKLLFDLARTRKVEQFRDAMFRGDKINFTEGRAVLHIALRNRSNSAIIVDGEDVMVGVNRVLAQMRDFTERFGMETGRVSLAKQSRMWSTLALVDQIWVR
jgi:glucose-6-phosphate isomerase